MQNERYQIKDKDGKVVAIDWDKLYADMNGGIDTEIFDKTSHAYDKAKTHFANYGYGNEAFTNIVEGMQSKFAWDEKYANLDKNIASAASAAIFNSLSVLTQEQKTAFVNSDQMDDYIDRTVEMQKALLDGSKTLAQQVADFNTISSTIAVDDEESRIAFNAQYSSLQSLSNFAASGGDIDKMTSWGISADEFIEMRDASGMDDFNTVFANAINSAGDDKSALITQLKKEGFDQKMINMVETALVGSSTAILENLTKDLSSIERIEGLAKKYQTGIITPEELEELQGLMDSDEFIKLMNGSGYDAITKRAKANQAAMDELTVSLQAAIASGDKASEKRIQEQIDMLEYAEYYSSELWESLKDITQAQVTVTRQQDKIKKLQEEYNKAETDKTENLKQQVAAYKEIENAYKEILTDPDYNDAIESGFIVDGKLTMTQEELSALKDNELAQWILANYDQIEEASNASKYVQEGYDTLLKQYKDTAKEAYEHEKELLEERRDTYEDYWDKVDTMEEEREREQDRDAIVRQLGAISGGSGAATNALRKDLLQQLQDVDEEAKEARKQAARDVLTENIDKHVEHIDEMIKNMDGWVIDTSGTSTTIKDSEGNILQKYASPQYASGGLVDYTGPAWVDGTKTRPEAFLSAKQTQLFAGLAIALQDISKIGSLSTSQEETSNITIGNINIQTQQLNDKQDFKNAGQIFAEEFSKAIKQRGLNINVRK
jgi:hypothetical protein